MIKNSRSLTAPAASPSQDSDAQPWQLELSSGGLLSQAAAGHLAALMASAAQAPTAMIHLLDGGQLRLVGGSGLPEQWESTPAVPLSSTIGGLVVAQGLPVVITDVTTDRRVPADNPGHAVGERAYVGFPIRDAEGHVAGVCAVLDYQTRPWQAHQLAAVDEGAQACTAFVIEQRSCVQADQSRRLLDALLDSLQTGVAACDASGRIVFNNAANRQLNDALPDDLDLRAWTQGRLAENPAATLPPAALPLVRALGGECLHNVEIILERPQQRHSVLLADAQPIIDAAGGSLGAVVSLQDVTARHNSAVLKDCELAVRRILSGSDTGPVEELLAATIATIGQTLDWAAVEFWAVDEVGNILRRENCWDTAGHPSPQGLPDQLCIGQGMPGRAWETSEVVWAENLSTDPDALAQTQDWGSLRSAVTVPVPIGSVTRGVLSCHSVYSEYDDARTSVLTGIAAHIGQFLERRRAGALTAELEHSRDEYIALVGHEIRTPLTSIGSYTELMMHAPDISPDERANMLAVVQRNVSDLHTIIDKLLDIAGMQAGRITVDPQYVDLTAIVRASAAAIEAHSPAANVDLRLPDQAILWGDSYRLTQVVEELLSNALAWANDAGRITASVTADGPSTQLTVSNTGPVIPAAERDRLFERFFRTSAARHQAIPGTGLGLSLARAIVEQHGGTISATTDDAPSGTTLTVRLPNRPPATTLPE
jgi:signal transduction histidine kinase/PAS domain-containing protein